MKKTSQLLLRVLKISGITLVSLLIILFFAPYLFPDTVSREIKQMTNRSIRGELNFTKARLSFFTHFPSLTLTLYDVLLKGSAPFQEETLLSAEKLGFGVNLEKLIFDHQVSINKIFLSHSLINVLADERGQANYNIYVSDSGAKAENSDTSASIHLEKIIIDDSKLVYDDRSIPMMIQAEHLYYEGTGDLSKSIFDLESHIRTDSLNFVFNNQPYVNRKAIDANLVTRVNTKTLALIFRDNQILMNKLHFGFTGKLDFLKNGYDLDFSLSTRDADFYQLITILPPQYITWLHNTTVKGSVNLTCTLKGKYIASTGQMPDYGMQLGMQDGYISYAGADLPVSRLNCFAAVELPSLDPEKLHIKLDSLNFLMGTDYFRSQMESFGLSEPELNMKADGQLDLRNLKKALGIDSFDMQGQLRLHLTASGKYQKKIVKTSFRNSDTVTASIPSFNLTCTLKNGVIKYHRVTQPVQNIFMSLHASCPDGDYRHAYLKLDTLHAAAMNNFVEGSAIVHASTDFPMDINLRGSVNLADIRQVYPMDSLSLSGLLRFDLKSTGKYAPEHHLFPKTNVHVLLRDGFIQTRYYPHPLEKINIEINARDKTADLKSLNLDIHPASLSFEGKPFYFRGSFKNFDDLNYDIAVNGDLDLGKIYQVFSRSGLGLTGFIRIHANFKGIQSDAKNERYNLLHNLGTMEVKNIAVRQELFPKPFLIRSGKFRFDRDKMWFDKFEAAYGESDLQLDGFAENVINYLLSKNETLKANFNLVSKKIDLNEFAVFAPAEPVQSKTRASSGVIMIPAILDLTVKADADRVLYNDIILDHFQGGLSVRNGGIELTETSFEMIGCRVSMKGNYTPTSFQRAGFHYQIEASNFDVHRAYQEIKLFHDLASSAQHASGIISINYSLGGTLNGNMAPVYPSLKGSGVLSVKNVKFNGWKLFNTVSSESGKSELKDPDLSKIDIHSSIKNNLITIEKLKFKTGGFRIRFEGQTSFDNQVNFKMRIGLPPLGIIGIPVRITGNADNPKIKMSKSDSDPLQEKEEE